jgi:signal transduction histidine kinase
MSLFLTKIITLLTIPPDNFIYHMVLVFSIAGALLGAARSLHSSNFPQERRTVIGLSIMLGLQLVMYIVSGLTWPGWLNSQLVLPPFDRAVTLLTLVWIAWLWAFPEPVRMADAATLLLSLLGIAVLGLTLVLLVRNPTSSFNLSWYEIGWQGFSIAVILLGILGLILRKPNGWSYGLAMLILAFLGHVISLFYRVEGNYPGIVRLTQLAMFPILLILSQRFASSLLVETPAVKSGNFDGQVQKRERYSTDPKAFHALMALAAETDSNKIGQALARGIGQAMLADLCFLITLGEDKSLAITSGYDLIHEKYLGGTTIDRDGIPLLANAIQRGRPLRLPASNTSSDLKSLGQALRLKSPGNLLCVPVTSPKRGSLGSVLILSPYSNRLWSAEDQIYLSNASSLFIPILERSQRTAALEIERDRSLKEAHNVMERATEAKKKYEQMAIELEGQRGKMTQSQLQTIMQEEAQNTIEQLRAENYRLRHAGGAPDAAGNQMERELRQALEEVAQMQGALADANTKILELEKRPASSIPTRKVDNLIQNTDHETGGTELKLQPFDLNLIIDNAMAYTSTQIREKNITLRLDLTSNTPRIQTDRDALQQILVHLLQNATAATQTEGNITLRVQTHDEGDNHFLLIQVSDNGGGIAAEDIPRVFTRRDQTEHPLIRGLGDSGVGLLITRALVEALNGRIWIETKPGVGSTFSVRIPVLMELPAGNQV